MQHGETTRNLGNGKDERHGGVDCVNFMSCQISVLFCVICGGLPESYVVPFASRSIASSDAKKVLLS